MPTALPAFHTSTKKRWFYGAFGPLFYGANMPIVHMLKGKAKGKCVNVSTEEAEKLIEEGKAQSLRTPPHLMKKPVRYKTRQIKADVIDGAA